MGYEIYLFCPVEWFPTGDYWYLICLSLYNYRSFHSYRHETLLTSVAIYSFPVILFSIKKFQSHTFSYLKQSLINLKKWLQMRSLSKMSSIRANRFDKGITASGSIIGWTKDAMATSFKCICLTNWRHPKKRHRNTYYWPEKCSFPNYSKYASRSAAIFI